MTSRHVCTLIRPDVQLQSTDILSNNDVGGTYHDVVCVTHLCERRLDFDDEDVGDDDSEQQEEPATNDR